MANIDHTTRQAIITWFRDHPNHYYESQSGSHHGLDDIQILRRFSRNPHSASEYEDPSNDSMSALEVQHGCIHVFQWRSCMTCRCNRPVQQYQTRCLFHSAAVFDPVIRRAFTDNPIPLDSDDSDYDEYSHESDSEDE